MNQAHTNHHLQTMALSISMAFLALMPAAAFGQAFSNAGSSLSGYAVATLAPGKTCESLGTYKAAELNQISAVSIASAANVPAHCRVTGTLAPEIAFEVSLPAKWNGRFYMIGNGGHAGESLEDAGRVSQRNAALQLGFAFAQTNTGHDSRREPGATFVLSNPQKAIDYAYRAVHLTAVTAKGITNNYYGRPASKSYWNSCSNGGRQGLLEAQRYPEDFDGIVVASPWVDQTGFTVGAIWNQQALNSVPLSAEKLALLADKVMAKCDAVDGLKDGLIDDPRKCAFDPAKDVPACPAGVDNATCLTSPQAAAIAKVYSGPVNSGKSVFPGFMLGSEAVTTGLFGGGSGSGWLNVIVNNQPNAKPADFNLAEGTIQYLAHKPPKPDYDYRTFNFGSDLALLDDWSKLADAKNPNLSAFRARGGKLLMTYGWADTILQPMMGVNYYEQALAANGRNTPDFFRLFMAPGMAHCGGGIGPNQHDAVTAVIDWVEKGQAPASLLASRTLDNQVVRTRPLCPYPQVARYSGQGSIDVAANFKCVNP